MVTMIDDDVLELWTSTVARTPIIRPAIGFCRRVLSENAEPIDKMTKKPNVSTLPRKVGHLLANVYTKRKKFSDGIWNH